MSSSNAEKNKAIVLQETLFNKRDYVAGGAFLVSPRSGA